MLLSELFNYIATLDSSSLDLDTNGDGVIVAGHYPKVINAINLGLIQLYAEFPVKEKSLVVQLYSHITNYELATKFAANSGSAETYKYILDTSSDPFLDDVSIIQTISNEIGVELAINQSNDLLSVYTPAYNMIQHPYPDNDNTIFVTYKARHVEIAKTATASTYVVDIPSQLLPLLLIYVNHKLLASINKEESMAKLSEYVGALRNAKTMGLFVSEGSSNEKLEDSGWL